MRSWNWVFSLKCNIISGATKSTKSGHVHGIKQNFIREMNPKQEYSNYCKPSVLMLSLLHLPSLWVCWSQANVPIVFCLGINMRYMLTPIRYTHWFLCAKYYKNINLQMHDPWVKKIFKFSSSRMIKYFISLKNIICQTFPSMWHKNKCSLFMLHQVVCRQRQESNTNVQYGWELY